jgi:lysophospholipase L1-like esterase
MEPLWEAQTVYYETVLLVSKGRKPASGKLMFTPKQILAVHDYGLKNRYFEHRDFRIRGRTLTRVLGSRLPFVTHTALPSRPYEWYALDGQHLAVTYTHQEHWPGPRPHYRGMFMPRTVRKLRQRRSLTVVALGDSITCGNNVSGYMEMPPYMPPWADLFVRRLKQLYGYDDIRLHNTAVSGATSDWGLHTVDSLVAARHPDLVLIAFGMNDLWYISPKDFQKNVQAIIERVRVYQREAEFLLLAPMQFDPAYSRDRPYANRSARYARALQALTRQGVQLLDMNALSNAVFAAKKPQDVLANPLHPNDFLARCYAQGLVAMLHPSEAKNNGRTGHHSRKH